MENKVQYRSGIGFTGMLAILFIGLKLTEYVNWPWIWVLSPLWIPVAIAMGVIMLAGLIAIGICIYKKITKART